LLHPETRQTCIEIAEKFGLGICGIDILSTDFSKPLKETGGIILEVNATPGLG
jgi:cyanophycin synthetase